jgi:hypothetical protein
MCVCARVCVRVCARVSVYLASWKYARKGPKCKSREMQEGKAAHTHFDSRAPALMSAFTYACLSQMSITV